MIQTIKAPNATSNQCRRKQNQEGHDGEKRQSNLNNDDATKKKIHCHE